MTAEILQEAEKGQEQLIEEVIALRSDTINVLIGRGCNLNDVEDVVQTSLLKAVESIRKGTVPSNLKSWFFSIACNTHIDSLRKKRYFLLNDIQNSDGKNDIEKFASILDELRAQDSPVDIIEQKEYESKRDEALHKVMEELGEDHRLVLTEHYFKGKKAREISEEFGIPLGTVCKRLHTGRNKLKEFLDSLKENADI